MNNQGIENLFKQIDQSSLMLQEALDLSYLDALIENGENILDGQTVRVIDDQPEQDVVEQLEMIYKQLNLSNFSAEEIRKALQFAILKAMKHDYVQSNHMMTPDIVGQYILYFLDLLLDKNKKSLRLAEWGCGSANLLTQLNNQLLGQFDKLQLEGIDIDHDLLALAVINSRLQSHDNIRLTHQDVLENLWLDPVDVVVSDLPIGYYPNKKVAEKFDLAVDEDFSYAHFLFIEQAVRYLKNGGFGFFVLPSAIFAEQSSKSLVQWIQKIGFIQALIQLPSVYVKHEKAQQSILIIQKAGEGAKQAKEVLFANAPESQQQQLLLEFLAEIKDWKKRNL